MKDLAGEDSRNSESEEHSQTFDDARAGTPPAANDGPSTSHKASIIGGTQDTIGKYQRDGGHGDSMVGAMKEGNAEAKQKEDSSCTKANAQTNRGTEQAGEQPGLAKQQSVASSSSSTSTQTPGGATNFSIRPFRGMISDLQARIPLYKGDWCQRPKSIVRVINATCFAFVVQLIPALIFAELLNRKTEGSLSVPEVLLSAGIIGVIYAILSGQPLVLLGITGPVAILLGTSYGLAQDLDNADYFTFFWWLCMWTSLLHLLSACLGLVQFVWIITPFTSQIFEFFIAMSFIYESIRDLVEPIHLADTIHASHPHGDGDVRFLESTTGSSSSPSSSLTHYDRSAAYAGLVVGLLTFQICWSLHFAETWVYATRQVRTFLTSYNMMIALVVMTAISYLPGIDQDDGIERVEIRRTPWDWKPTAHRSEWFTVKDPFDSDAITTRGIFGALFPAFMLYLLFFIDHNISSILTQAPKYNLQKPPAYHWDFFVLGLTIIPCALLGLPPGSGLIPQAPLHTRALCSREKKADNESSSKNPPASSPPPASASSEQDRTVSTRQANLSEAHGGSDRHRQQQYQQRQVPPPTPLEATMTKSSASKISDTSCPAETNRTGSDDVAAADAKATAGQRNAPVNESDHAGGEVFTHCEEQRWSALIQALLMFVALSLLEVIAWIPVGCLFGIFLYLGVGAMYGNEVWERIMLCLMLPKKRPKVPIVTKVSSWATVQAFTLVQIMCASLIFGIAQFADVGYIFPALVAGLVPFRIYVMPRLFSEEDLAYLDPVGETEEEYHQEQKEIVDVVRRRPSLDEAEIFHGFSELRTKNAPHDAKDYYRHHPDLPHPPVLDRDDDGGGDDRNLHDFDESDQFFGTRHSRQRDGTILPLSEAFDRTPSFPRTGGRSMRRHTIPSPAMDVGH